MAEDLVTAKVRQSLTQIPQFLTRSIDPSKLKVVQIPFDSPSHIDGAIAAVDPKDPNTIQIHNTHRFLNPTNVDGSASSILAHELTHVHQNNTAPGVNTVAADPAQFNAQKMYDYGGPEGLQAANSRGVKANAYTAEQQAAIVGHYTTIMNNPNLSAADKSKYAHIYLPVVRQIAQQPLSTIEQSDATPGVINTNPRAPAPPISSSDLIPQPLMENAPPAPSAPISSDDWEDAPKGSGVQTSDDWEDVQQPSATEQFNHTAAQRGIGVAKSLGDALAYSNPLTGGIRQMGGMKFLDSSNTDQTIGKVTGDVMQAAATPEIPEAIASGVKSLTTGGKARMGTLLDSNISGALHNDLGSTLSKVAQEAGVEVEPTNDIRKAVGNVATAIRDKAQSKLDEVDELFKGLSDDDAPAGLEHYSDIQKAITKKEKDLNMLRSSTPPKPSSTTATSDAMSAAQKAEQKTTAIRTEINALKGQKATADSALDAQGLQGAREQADRLFEQADALDKLRKAHAKSTFGGPGSGQTNPAKFHEQLGDMHDSGELHAALGEDHAQNLMDSTGRASRLMDRNAKIRKYGAIGAGAAGLGKLVSGASHLSELIP